MNVLSIGSDEHVFEAGSAVRARQEAYAQELGHVDLVALSKRPRESKKGQTLSVFAAYAGSPVSRLFRAWKIARGLAKPDVVTVQDPFEIGLVGWFVARRFGVPLHVQLHTEFLAPAYAALSLRNRIRVRIATFVLRRATRIRVVSERTKRSLEARSPKLKAAISVLPIFVDIEKFGSASVPADLASRFATFTRKLLVVARLEREKNVALAIRAFADAAPENACLIIVGQGSQCGRLQALANERAVSDRVFFEGAQDPAPYYALASLVIVPSAYEGYGLVIIEALAAGKPVLSTDVGVAREAGSIVSSIDSFAHSLKAWFENGPRTAALKRYPYKNFEEYVQAYCRNVKESTWKKERSDRE